MSKTVVATVSVFTFLGVWNDYLWPSLVFTSSDLLTAQIGLNAITANENTTIGQTLAAITLITMELYDHPVNKLVAGFIGSPQMNFFDVTIEENEVIFTDGNKITLPDNVIRQLGRKTNGLIMGVRGEDIKDTFSSDRTPAKRQGSAG